jgi:hypothetical protein
MDLRYFEGKVQNPCSNTLGTSFNLGRTGNRKSIRYRAPCNLPVLSGQYVVFDGYFSNKDGTEVRVTNLKLYNSRRDAERGKNLLHELIPGEC